MQPLIHSLWGRGLSLFLILAMLSIGCRPAWLAVEAGLWEYQRRALISVPGGVVNAVTASLVVTKMDITVDTAVVEEFGIQRVYNSATGDWLWNFEVSYDGSTFVDPTGVNFDVSEVANGDAIPGTHWVRVDATTMKTKGGLGLYFDGGGKLDYVAWIHASHPRIEYTWSAGQLEIAQCTAPGLPVELCPLLYTVALGNAGPTGVTGERTGRQVSYGYDFMGRLETVRTPFEIEEALPGTTYEYETLGTLLTAVVNSEGERIEYGWQAGRRISFVRQIGEGDPEHRFRFNWDFSGSKTVYRTVHTSPRGGVTKYRLDSQRRLLSVLRENTGEQMSLVWVGKRPAAVTAFNGTTTHYQYQNDNVSLIIHPSGNWVGYSYESNGVNFEDPLSPPFKRIWDILGLVGEQRYDGLGRPEELENGEGEIISRGYSASTLSSLTIPFGTTTDFTVYGVHGHWLDANVPENPFVLRRAFDPVGNMLVPGAGLQEGGVLEKSYNANRLLDSVRVAVTNDDGLVTSDDDVLITRRSDGKALTVTRPGGADHQTLYDALGRVETVRELVGGQWVDTAYEYDLSGNPVAVERPNGMREEFDYDVYDRVIERGALRDGQLEAYGTITWVNGQMATYYDSVRDQTEVMAYDSAGRVSTVTYDAFGESITLLYDIRSRVKLRTYRLGAEIRTVGFEYDLADRQTRVYTDGNETLAEFFYDAGTKQSQVIYGNGLVRDHHYNSSGALTGFTTTHPVNGVVESTTITRTAENSPTRMEITSATTTPLAATDELYWLQLGGNLQDLSRLVGARVWYWENDEGDSDSFAYDELSNMRSDSDGDTFTYTAESNRLLSATVPTGNYTYTYDEAGFATSRNGVPITWTATGRLASYGPLSIVWDMAGQPVSIDTGIETREFTMFGGKVEWNSGAGSVGPINLGFASLAFGGSERLFRHPDFRANVSFVSDENGDIVAHYRYTPYGVDRVFGDSSDLPKFAGAADLGGTGLVLMGARIYDSAVGRFLSIDPKFQVLNHYAYALGNPVLYWDRDGQEFGRLSEVGTAASELYEAGLAVLQAAVVFVGLVVAAVLAPAGLATVVAVTAALAAGIGVLLAGSAALRAYDAYRDAQEAAGGGQDGGGGQVKKLELQIEGEDKSNASSVRQFSLGFAAGGGSSSFGGTGGLAVPTLGEFGGVCGCCDSPVEAVSSSDPRSWLLTLLALYLLLGLAGVSLQRGRNVQCSRSRRTLQSRIA